MRRRAAGEVADNAASLVEEGYRHLKVKLDGDHDLDVGRVRAVRERVGREIHLTADANQTYTPKAAIRALRAMEPYGLDLIEQPVAADDIAGLKLVTESVSAIVEADEAANTVAEIADLVQRRAVDSINLKVTHVGGLRRAKVAKILALLGTSGRCNHSIPKVRQDGDRDGAMRARDPSRAAGGP